MLKSKSISIITLILFFNIVFSQNEESNSKSWKINPKITSNTQNKSLFVLNDVIVSEEALKIDPKNIEKVIVLKNNQTIEKYGEKGKNGVIEVTTKNISKKELKKLYLTYPETYLPNTKGNIKTIIGKIVDCENEPIKGVSILNLNSKAFTTSDSLGNYSIEARKNDVLQIAKMGFEGKKVLISNEKTLNFYLKAVQVPQGVIYRKPVIYLYPTKKTEVKITLDVNGKLLTTFPKYDKNWNVIAAPNGQIYDTKTKRNYSSLFWDANVQLPKEHYPYKDGFIISKEKLTEFFIEKLEHIGLNNQETNEFIQFWLPILEQNKYNFIHFLVKDACNEIAKLSVNPKPETTIRIYMEYYGLEEMVTVNEQVLPKIQRKGFTLVEWGGAAIKL